jgi:dTDP-4-dehydrorhamnose reductase
MAVNVNSTKTEDYPTRARRPKNSKMKCNYKIYMNILYPLGKILSNKY